MIWGGTGTWDFKLGMVINFNRAFFFEGEIVPVVLTIGSSVHRFIPLKFGVSEIGPFTKLAVKMMGRYVVRATIAGDERVPFSDESFRVMEVRDAK